ncbi:MAG: hypothetical protein ACREPM_08320 [Gemmatimonadaceae bacterium]
MRSLMTALLMAGAAVSLGAQGVTIDPGMSREQVMAKLGEPLSARTYDGHTYLLYKNGCEKTCGMNDLVVLDSGKVVDAVFRAPDRKYSGTSSSPRMISQAEARRGNGGGAPLALPSREPKAPSRAPAKTTAPAPTKSAPVKPAPVKPAPAKPAPATKPPTIPPPKTNPAVPPPKKPGSTPAKKDTAKKTHSKPGT